MKEMKVEWVREDDLYQTEGSVYRTIPVVRLSEVETLLREAVWAMEALITHRIASWADVLNTDCKDEEVQYQLTRDSDYQRAQAFLASPAVAEWRKREEKAVCQHQWGTDGQHSNEFCKKCFVDKARQEQKETP